MRTYSTVSTMYDTFSRQPDPMLAAQAVTHIWVEKLQQWDASVRQRKIDKMVQYAAQEPAQRFGVLVEELARQTHGSLTFDSAGLAHGPTVPKVLSQETAVESLLRVLDPVGRVANTLCGNLRDLGYDPAVLVRVRFRLVALLQQEHALDTFYALLREMESQYNVGIPALWKAIEWFELPELYWDVDAYVDALVAECQRVSGQPEPLLSHRELVNLAPARLLLGALVSTRPQAFPAFKENPGLETALSLWLAREIPRIERAYQALEHAKRLLTVFDAFTAAGPDGKPRGDTAIDALPTAYWKPEERQAVRAYCHIGATMKRLEQRFEAHLDTDNLPSLQVLPGQVVNASAADDLQAGAGPASPKLDPPPLIIKLAMQEDMARIERKLHKNPGDAALVGAHIALLLDPKRALILERPHALDDALADMSALIARASSAVSYAQRADLYLDAHRPAEALADATTGLNMIGHDVVDLLVGRLYFQRASAHLKLRHPPLQAWVDAQKSLMLTPDLAPEMLLVHKEATVAEEEAFLATLMPPVPAQDRDVAQMRLRMSAHGRLMLGHWDEAIHDCDALLARNNHDAEVQAWRDAAVELQKVSRLTPDLAQSLGGLSAHDVAVLRGQGGLQTVPEDRAI